MKNRGRAIGSPQRDLTAHEIQILALVAEGLTNAEIGHRLRLTENTVKTHIQRILRALGASNRWGAVGRGFRLWILH